MSVSDIEGYQILIQIQHYLGISDKELLKLTQEKNEILPDSSCGFMWMVCELVMSSKLPLLGNRLEEQVLIEQWLEYIFMQFIHSNSLNADKILSLKELNAYMAYRTYFAGNRISIADILLYYTLHPIFNKFSFFEKEQYVAIGRWFDNIQQDSKIRQSHSKVLFTRSLLYTY